MTVIDSNSSDGLVVFAQACSRLKIDMVPLIEDTCFWVDPKTFRELSVWYPEFFRGAPLYDSRWQKRSTNTSKSTGQTVEKLEANIQAARALWQALGFFPTAKPNNWTVCHIWGIDDDRFQKSNKIVRDPRYYSCVGNMVALPTPLKSLTDAVPEIKSMLRVCAYWLFGWVCDSEDVRAEAEAIKDGYIPDRYPATWPTAQRQILPRGLMPYDENISSFIKKRKFEIRRDLANPGLDFYPREQVQGVLKHWDVQL